MAKTNRKPGLPPEEIRKRMYQYWDKVFDKDLESKNARTLLKNISDPESLFNNVNFLHGLIDDLEKEKRVKSTRSQFEEEEKH
jgi:hypothetical protein